MRTSEPGASQLSEAQHRLIVELVRARLPAVEAVYVFGSLASGAGTATSDVDIAVLAPEALDAAFRYALAEALAEALGRDADVVDLRVASTVMRSQVVAGGERLYAQAGAQVEAFEAFVLSDYARLNEERAEILADIRQRGSVRGG